MNRALERRTAACTVCNMCGQCEDGTVAQVFVRHGTAGILLVFRFVFFLNSFSQNNF